MATSLGYARKLSRLAWFVKYNIAQSLLEVFSKTDSYSGVIKGTSFTSMIGLLSFKEGDKNYYFDSDAQSCTGSLSLNSSVEDVVVFDFRSSDDEFIGCPLDGSITVSRDGAGLPLSISVYSNTGERPSIYGVYAQGILENTALSAEGSAEDSVQEPQSVYPVGKDLSIGADENSTAGKEVEDTLSGKSDSVLYLDISSMSAFDFWSIARLRGAEMEEILAFNQRSFDSEFDEQRYVKEFTNSIEQKAKSLSVEFSDILFNQASISVSAYRDFNFDTNTQVFELNNYAKIGRSERIQFNFDPKYVRSSFNFAQFSIHFNDISAAERISTEVNANGALIDLNCGWIEIDARIRPMMLSCTPYFLSARTKGGELLFSLAWDSSNAKWTSEKVSDLWEIAPY